MRLSLLLTVISWTRIFWIFLLLLFGRLLPSSLLGYATLWTPLRQTSTVLPSLWMKRKCSDLYDDAMIICLDDLSKWAY
ncbi:hypothetical protein BT96DRAFT_570267 [Gymnopus androsaceus JB14]|uniref:Uncharacterized protein n=1 Tax=Gymnopus androsaceus JB14 TaxID=1447944 RepID=A0A6A4HZ68_9AGAR|nr:hypothetical protein BT96DRAFT_570267 [Gymnopus androsaceus JB14]